MGHRVDPADLDVGEAGPGSSACWMLMCLAFLLPTEFGVGRGLPVVVPVVVGDDCCRVDRCDFLFDF